MNYISYVTVSLLVIILCSFIISFNTFFEKKDINYNRTGINVIYFQTSYAIEEEKHENDDDEDDYSNNKKDKSIFNIVAVGDWDCTGETEDTVENIVEQDPELVLALGDFSYNGDAECWLEIIEPISNKTKIVFGNHEKGLEEKYMEFFGLKEQYYSFNYKNIHFLALSTETDYDDDSEQYEFAISDLEKYSKDPFIDWIIVFYHDHIYGSGSLEEETYFREIYHPLFDKHKVDLALQAHYHVYERTYPLTFNYAEDNEPIVENNVPNLYKNPKIIKLLTNNFNNYKDDENGIDELLAPYNNNSNPNIYKNSNGTVFVTVGTGGAHTMVLSSLEDYSAKGIDSTFGILDITLENYQKILIGNFIENGKKKQVLDEFKIIKE
ncbi:MAG TPA: metallophosphoesterase [Nitrososphaeraceae archaeon]